MTGRILAFHRSFASHEKARFWSDKNTTRPENVLRCSHTTYLFDCSVCNHTFEIGLHSIMIGQWCLYCAGRRLCGKDNCQMCINRSFATHARAINWSESNNITPNLVFKFSHTIYLFNCDCGHIVSISPHAITGGNWCSFCSHQKLCDKYNCLMCYENSFASHPRSENWSEINTLVPREVFKNSAKRYLFVCNVCNHLFNGQLSSINIGAWCPFCAHMKLCTNDECQMCFNSSFASHPRAIYWSSINTVTPRLIFKTSGKHWFDCNICNKPFISYLSNIVAGTWCSCCKNKTEFKLYTNLLIYQSIITNFKASWCKRVHQLPFDFCIQEYKIIIELDGLQHFIQVTNWKSPKETQAGDLFKQTCANNNGYSVIRILQEDVWYDRYNWLSELNTNIDKIKHEQIVQNIYMCKNDEYRVYIDAPQLLTADKTSV